MLSAGGARSALSVSSLGRFPPAPALLAAAKIDQRRLGRFFNFADERAHLLAGRGAGRGRSLFLDQGSRRAGSRGPAGTFQQRISDSLGPRPGPPAPLVKFEFLASADSGPIFPESWLRPGRVDRLIEIHRSPLDGGVRRAHAVAETSSRPLTAVTTSARAIVRNAGHGRGQLQEEPDPPPRTKQDGEARSRDEKSKARPPGASGPM